MCPILFCLQKIMQNLGKEGVLADSRAGDTQRVYHQTTRVPNQVFIPPQVQLPGATLCPPQESLAGGSSRRAHHAGSSGGANVRNSIYVHGLPLQDGKGPLVNPNDPELTGPQIDFRPFEYPEISGSEEPKPAPTMHSNVMVDFSGNVVRPAQPEGYPLEHAGGPNYARELAIGHRLHRPRRFESRTQLGRRSLTASVECPYTPKSRSS
ncbi:hypothetical protein T439DRAFT_172819 [Meredithblackwellia eburnea MCA 4105]